MLKQDDKLELNITSYGSNGEGIGNYNEYTIFVNGALVGEKVLVKVTYVKKNVAYAKLLQVLSPSSKRIAPPCKYYGICGGCMLQHMSIDEENAFKQDKVRTNFKKLAGMDVNVLPTFFADELYGYRNKLSLPIGGNKGNVKIGMYKENSHEVVDIDNCLLGGEWMSELTRITKEYLNSNGVEPYNERTFKGEIRHVVARYIDEQLLVMAVSNGVFKHNLTPYFEALCKSFARVGLFVNINEKHNNVILGGETKHIAGIEYITGNHFGVNFRLRPESFFQVNNKVKDAIYADAKRLLDTAGTEVLVDLFSGVGVLTSALASKSYDTFAVEIVSSAVKDADEIMQINNAPRVTNICGDAKVELPKIVAKNKGKVMSLVVDPPRKGLGEDVCKTILQAEFNNIVYISCDSATLARDVKALSEKYSIAYIRSYNMFPRTTHVETVVLMSRK